MSPGTGGTGGSRGQAAPDVYAAPSAHQLPGTRKRLVCTTDKRQWPRSSASSTDSSETESKRHIDISANARIQLYINTLIYRYILWLIIACVVGSSRASDRDGVDDRRR
jgi:hypothetical protein